MFRPHLSLLQPKPQQPSSKVSWRLVCICLFNDCPFIVAIESKFRPINGARTARSILPTLSGTLWVGSIEVRVLLVDLSGLEPESCYGKYSFIHS